MLEGSDVSHEAVVLMAPVIVVWRETEKGNRRVSDWQVGSVDTLLGNVGNMQPRGGSSHTEVQK